MEEDIKILEEFIEKTDVDYKCNYNECVIPDEIERILKRFIKRYKELEEENAMLKKANNIAEDVTVEDITQVVNKSLEDFKKEFIPISVIQNKKQELEKKKEYLKDEYDEGVVDILCRYSFAIKTLDEILEKGNK